MEGDDEGVMHFAQDFPFVYDLLHLVLVHDFPFADHLHRVENPSCLLTHCTKIE